MPTVAGVDQSRPVWPSCPASGWASGVDRLTTRPNNKTLKVGVGPGTYRPSGFPQPQETHGPYIGLGGGDAGHLGEGARTPAAVQEQMFKPAMMATAAPSYTGPSHESWYVGSQL